ncbi:MAG: hypothetical protein H6978_09415 [Gammaproteobacteria bacterium]|nr:hypothetical protein [Gammaproteobacteria bacterium]
MEHQTNDGSCTGTSATTVVASRRLTRDGAGALAMPALLVTSMLFAGCGDVSIESPGDPNAPPVTGSSSSGGSSSGGSSGGGTTTCSCPAGATEVTVGTETHCSIAGTITTDMTLNNACPVQIADKVTIGVDAGSDPNSPVATADPAVLTIQPGTVLYGIGTDSLLIISRGSRLIADGGDPANGPGDPIIFTSAQDLGYADELGLANTRAPFSGLAQDDPYTQEWGGIIINGRAPNNRGTDVPGEGGTGTYGGNTPADDSGVLRFVQVKYAGEFVDATTQLNGIAFQSVGSGTVVDYVQVHNNADDGIEFFGGAVNVKHVVITGSADDSLDFVQGYNGNIQFGVVVQNPNFADSDSCIEDDTQSLDNAGDPDAMPFSDPKLVNITCVGASTFNAQATTGEGLHPRAGTAGHYANIVVANFNGETCLEVDDQQTFDRIAAGLLKADSVVLDCDPAAPVKDGTEFLASGANNDANFTNSLSGVIPVVNGGNEAAVTPFDPTTLGSFFDAVTFIGGVNSAGAFDPVNGNWLQGWTFGMEIVPDTCPTSSVVTTTTVNSETVCEIGGTLTTDLTLPFGPRYRLADSLRVGVDCGSDSNNPAATCDAAVLTIAPGVTIEARTTVGNDAPILVVNRGSRIVANGTRNAPITFTAEGVDMTDATALTTQIGLWGGVIINGRAPNNRGTDVPGEGGTGTYGGNEPTDNSGVLRYVRIMFGGNFVDASTQINGLSLQAVGNGTLIENVQVHNNADDGIELFGGTVNLRNIVITGSADDSIDWVQGYTGNIQTALVVQNPNFADSDSCIEADTQSLDNAGDPDAMPFSAGIVSNVTCVGASHFVATATTGEGLHPRAGTAGSFNNIVVIDFLGETCLEVDDSQTTDRINANLLDANSMLLDCGAVPNKDATDLLNSGTNNNGAFTNSLQVPARFGANSAVPYVNGANEQAVPALDPTTLGAFFQPLQYVGAVNSDATDFTEGWTVWLDVYLP